MADTRIAKLFNNGASQAVSLPAEFRFEGEEVYATRDEFTGDVVLSIRPRGQTWVEFVDSVEAIAEPGNVATEKGAPTEPTTTEPTTTEPTTTEPTTTEPAPAPDAV
jgi:antitoxin VapB